MDQNAKIVQCRECMRVCSCGNSGFDLLLRALESLSTDSSLLHDNTPAEEECGPQKPQTESHMLLGAAPLKLKQPVIFAPGFLTAKTNPPLLDWYDAPAKEKRGPQQPWIECHMLLGAAPLKLKQPVIFGPGFLTAKTNPPLLDWYDAPAQEKCVPQQPWTECHMPLGASLLSLQQPVRPAPGPALPSTSHQVPFSRTTSRQLLSSTAR
ncbi:unnamed protein product [Pleuronectes platessa]|uniref:Uncharacterized protein n=1 Tax=Pleuronectes platessa TaxID=8262 RepID=A0A9N7YRH7_PLEPL|nr:unnamed protein product [Pleuronectes platessa]